MRAYCQYSGIKISYRCFSGQGRRVRMEIGSTHLLVLCGNIGEAIDENGVNYCRDMPYQHYLCLHLW